MAHNWDYLSFSAYNSSLHPPKDNFTIVRGVYGKQRYITCSPIGKLFMLIMATLPSTLILYLWAVFVWQCRTGFVWVKRVWNGRSKVPPNARCVPSYDFSTLKVDVQSKFTNKLLLFMVTLPIGKMWRRKKHLAGKKFDDDDEVQEEVMTWFKGQAADFYDSGIQKLVPRLNKCLDNAGDYVEK